VAALVVNGCVCGVARSDDCVTRLDGDVTWCSPSDSVNNRSPDWVIGLTPIGNTPSPSLISSGSTLAGHFISGRANQGAVLVAPGGSAQIFGPTQASYDPEATVALQAATALCNASKMCSLIDKTSSNFEQCIEGAASTLYDASWPVMPDSSQIVGYVQTAQSCRQAVRDMRQLKAELEKKPAPRKPITPLQDEAAVDEILKVELPKKANIKPLGAVKAGIFEELGKLLSKVRVP